MDSKQASQPSRDAPDPQPDPGRAWRRLARIGAVLTAVVTVVPADTDGTILQFIVANLGRLSDLAWLYSGESYPTYYNHVFGGLGGLILVVPLVAAVVIGVISGPDGEWSSFWRIIRIVLSMTGVLVTAGATYGFLLIYFFRAMGYLWIPHLYLFLAALPLLDGWHRRNAALGMFWLGTYLVISGCLASGLCMYGVVSLRSALDLGPMDWQTWIVLNGFMAGSVLTATGWFLWWRALRRSLKPNL
jgi:hypothetical protein